MDDLISRKSAIDEVHKEFDECLVWDESGECTANEIERILESLPSAQQKPLKYTGESICLYCQAVNCDGCMYEPMTTEAQ